MNGLRVLCDGWIYKYLSAKHMGRRTAAQGRGKRKPKAQRENDAGQGLGGPRTSATQANANAHLEKFVKVSPDDVDFDPEYVSLQKPSGNQSFTILSWNVLAQKFMHGHWRCPSFGVFRHAATRIPQIAAILDAADPDILCLQEVDGEIYTYLKVRSSFFVLTLFSIRNSSIDISINTDGCVK